MEPTKTILLRESDTLNIETGQSDKKYVPININEMKKYINEDLCSIIYPYQKKQIPDKNLLIKDIKNASITMKKRMSKYKIESNYNVVLKVFNKSYLIYPNFNEIYEDQTIKEKLVCKMDERLLRQILDRKSYWNNAEIGGHINFFRSPNEYEPDLHVGLQFFHL